MSEKKSNTVNLEWSGKEGLQSLDSSPVKLVEDIELSLAKEPSTNCLIHGDSLPVLRSLESKYSNTIKCIYIDPPYNTGSEFEFYDDGISHSEWLTFMRERLIVLRKLLSDKGMIFVQIDDNEMAYLQLIMDEIFGRKNRVNTICVKMSEASGVKMSHVKKRLPKVKEYILCYRKSESFEFTKTLSIPLQNWNYEYKLFLKNYTRDMHQQLKDTLKKTPLCKEDCVEMNQLLSQVEIVSVKKILEGSSRFTQAEKETWRFENAWRIVQDVGSTSVKKYADKEPKAKQHLATLLSPTGIMYLYRTTYNREAKQPRVQILFAEDNMSYHPGDFWSDIKTTGGVAKEGGTVFPNGKKPEKLIQRIIEISTNKGDCVLDCFLGSGTTAAVAHKMQRKWIGIEKGNQIYTHCLPRIRAVIEGEQSGISQDISWIGGGGFHFLKQG